MASPPRARRQESGNASRPSPHSKGRRRALYMRRCREHRSPSQRSRPGRRPPPPRTEPLREAARAGDLGARRAPTRQSTPLRRASSRHRAARPPGRPERASGQAASHLRVPARDTRRRAAKRPCRRGCAGRQSRTRAAHGPPRAHRSAWPRRPWLRGESAGAARRRGPGSRETTRDYGGGPATCAHRKATRRAQATRSRAAGRSEA